MYDLNVLKTFIYDLMEIELLNLIKVMYEVNQFWHLLLL